MNWFMDILYAVFRQNSEAARIQAQLEKVKSSVIQEAKQFIQQRLRTQNLKIPLPTKGIESQQTEASINQKQQLKIKSSPQSLKQQMKDLQKIKAKFIDIQAFLQQAIFQMNASQERTSKKIRQVSQNCRQQYNKIAKQSLQSFKQSAEEYLKERQLVLEKQKINQMYEYLSTVYEFNRKGFEKVKLIVDPKGASFSSNYQILQGEMFERTNTNNNQKPAHVLSLNSINQKGKNMFFFQVDCIQSYGNYTKIGITTERNRGYNTEQSQQQIIYYDFNTTKVYRQGIELEGGRTFAQQRKLVSVYVDIKDGFISWFINQEFQTKCRLPDVFMSQCKIYAFLETYWASERDKTHRCIHKFC